MKKTTVVFDLDGTLLDSYRILQMQSIMHWNSRECQSVH